MNDFKLSSEFTPKGDQQKAIDLLVAGLKKKKKFQTLLGVTGSGKTFTMAKVIEEIRKPTLVMVHNKTLAAQLYQEFKTFFPENAVGYFVSYYDYYQPEAYLPTTDTYIEKDSSINETIDQMRHLATASLFERNDVIIVSSVSSIYGLGSPEAYHGMLLYLETGGRMDREEILRKLVEIQYDRNDIDFYRGTFRVRGDVIEVFPASSDTSCIRISLFGDEIEAIEEIDPLRGEMIRKLPKIAIYPGSHYVIPPERLQTALQAIEQEMEERILYFEKEKKLIEAQRIEQRTRFDLEMIREIGFCQGIENYSRHFSGRKPGEPPPTLIDYFPDDFLLLADESHATIPQIRGMYAGDFSRKTSLVEYGFRLPSAFDNRPLKFEEYEHLLNQVIFVSATPGPYEIEKCQSQFVEQVIRPTGLIDQKITVKPAKGQVDDLLEAIHLRVEKNERVLVTTLTKRMAEDLTEYYHDLGIKVKYLHSDIETLERMEILRDLRLGKFDVLVGINLLREGLDLPEVSLVAILDADKEGFLRSHRSLIQTIGRAARHLHGEVYMYADKLTDSMGQAINETNRRREIQMKYNQENHIVPVSVKSGIPKALYEVSEADYLTVPLAAEAAASYIPQEELGPILAHLEKEMRSASKELDFERAAELRDKIKSLKESSLRI
ncbi:MAG: excinuclease ABC subunit UvrB [Nitrospirae bacterium]|nr:excinuclease ABC subunit UvrB [Nitrospirota bacterium]